MEQSAVSLKAFLLYCFYCKHGSMKKNWIKVSLQKAADLLFKGDLSNAAKYHRELVAQKWIAKSAEPGEIILLKGFDFILETDPLNVEPEVVGFTTNQLVNPTTSQMVNFTTGIGAEVVNFTIQDGKFYHSHNKEVLNQPFNQPNTAAAEPHRIPDKFPITQEMLEWAKNHKTVSKIDDLQDATDRWHDHWKSATGSRALSSDWQAVWRKGMRDHFDWQERQKQKGEINGHNGKETKSANGIQPGRAAQKSGAARNFGANPVIIK